MSILSRTLQVIPGTGLASLRFMHANAVIDAISGGTLPPGLHRQIAERASAEGLKGGDDLIPNASHSPIQVGVVLKAIIAGNFSGLESPQVAAVVRAAIRTGVAVVEPHLRRALVSDPEVLAYVIEHGDDWSALNATQAYDGASESGRRAVMAAIERMLTGKAAEPRERLRRIVMNTKSSTFLDDLSFHHHLPQCRPWIATNATAPGTANRAAIILPMTSDVEVLRQTQLIAFSVLAPSGRPEGRADYFRALDLLASWVAASERAYEQLQTRIASLESTRQARHAHTDERLDRELSDLRHQAQSLRFGVETVARDMQFEKDNLSAERVAATVLSFGDRSNAQYSDVLQALARNETTPTAVIAALTDRANSDLLSTLARNRGVTTTELDRIVTAASALSTAATEYDTASFYPRPGVAALLAVAGRPDSAPATRDGILTRDDLAGPKTRLPTVDMVIAQNPAFDDAERWAAVERLMASPDHARDLDAVVRAGVGGALPLTLVRRLLTDPRTARCFPPAVLAAFVQRWRAARGLGDFTHAAEGVEWYHGSTVAADASADFEDLLPRVRQRVRDTAATEPDEPSRDSVFGRDVLAQVTELLAQDADHAMTRDPAVVSRLQARAGRVAAIMAIPQSEWTEQTHEQFTRAGFEATEIVNRLVRYTRSKDAALRSAATEALGTDTLRALSSIVRIKAPAVDQAARTTADLRPAPHAPARSTRKPTI